MLKKRWAISKTKFEKTFFIGHALLKSLVSLWNIKHIFYYITEAQKETVFAFEYQKCCILQTKIELLVCKASEIVAGDERMGRDQTTKMWHQQGTRKSSVDECITRIRQSS